MVVTPEFIADVYAQMVQNDDVPEYVEPDNFLRKYFSVEPSITYTSIGHFRNLMRGFANLLELLTVTHMCGFYHGNITIDKIAICGGGDADALTFTHVKLLGWTGAMDFHSLGSRRLNHASELSPPEQLMFGEAGICVNPPLDHTIVQRDTTTMIDMSVYRRAMHVYALGDMFAMGLTFMYMIRDWMRVHAPSKDPFMYMVEEQGRLCSILNEMVYPFDVVTGNYVMDDDGITSQRRLVNIMDAILNEDVEVVKRMKIDIVNYILLQTFGFDEEFFDCDVCFSLYMNIVRKGRMCALSVLRSIDSLLVSLIERQEV